MKKILCSLLALLIACAPALAENAGSSADIIPDPTLAISPITPAPSPEPLGTVFSSEDLIVTLPLGMEILDDAALEGYEAAVQSDYPDTARTVLVAINEDGTSALSFAIADSNLDALAAAKDAHEKILGNSDHIVEETFGENSCAGFACAIGEQIYQIYYISNGSQMLIIGASGIDEESRTEMLTGLIF